MISGSLTLAGISVSALAGGAAVLLLAVAATMTAMISLRPYRYGGSGIPRFIPLAIGAIAIVCLAIAWVGEPALKITLGPAGGGLLLGTVGFSLLARYREESHAGHLFEPAEPWPIEEVYDTLYEADEGESPESESESEDEDDEAEDEAGKTDPATIQEELVEDIESGEITDVSGDPVYECKDSVRSFVNILYAKIEPDRQNISWKQKLTRIQAEYTDSPARGTTNTDFDDDLVSQLKTVRNTHELDFSRQENDVPRRLIQHTIDHIKGKQPADTVATAFEDALDQLYDRRKAVKRLRTCNRNLEQNHADTPVAELLEEKASVLRESTESHGARQTTGIFLSKMAGRLEETTDLRTKLEQCRRAQSTLENRLTSLDDQLDEDWVVSRTNKAPDDQPGGIVEAGIESGVVGERVATEAAKQVRDNQGAKYNRGSLAQELIENIATPVTEQTDVVTETIGSATETVHKYSFVEPHFDTERTKADVEAVGNNAIDTARQLDVPGLERAVRSHVKDELRNLRTVSDEDFVTRHLAYIQLRTLAQMLNQFETDRTETLTKEKPARESELDEKKQQAERLMEESGGPVIAIAEHYLKLVSELQNRAARAGSEERSEALLTATDQLLDHIIEMYRNPDLEDALAWMD